MPSPRVQTNFSTTSGPQASDTVTLSAGVGKANVTPGNSLVLCVFSDGPVASVSGTDTWKLTGTFDFEADGGNWVSIFYVQSAVGGATTATAHYSPNADDIITLTEYPPTGGVRIFGKFAEAGVTPTNPSVSLTGTAVNDIVAYLICGAGTAQTIGNIGTNPAFVVEQLLSDILMADGVSSGGTVTCTSTGTTAFWLGIAVALLPAAAGGFGLSVAGIHYM